MPETRFAGSGAHSIGRMVSMDDLRLQERLNAASPRWCEMGEDCVMYGEDRDGVLRPQRLRRTNADPICSPCRREHRIPAIEKLKANGHALRFPVRPEPPFLKVEGKQ